MIPKPRVTIWKIDFRTAAGNPAKEKNGALAGIFSVPVCLRITPSWLCFRVGEDFLIVCKYFCQVFPAFAENGVLDMFLLKKEKDRK